MADDDEKKNISEQAAEAGDKAREAWEETKKESDSNNENE